MKWKFNENIELDAYGVLASMKGGINGYMQYAFQRKQYFTTTKKAMDRAKWLKKQPKSYLDKVTKRIIEIENNGN